ncbi:MAG: MarR family transcriptional regulator [Planctomycetota bacterium]|nr:MarR family transcriptional regulator [Planctomycetota bacterium]
MRAVRASAKDARALIESGTVSARAGAETEKGGATAKRPTWTFLSNHAHVLLLIARDPEIRLRDVADQVGITERAVQRIVSDLEGGRYIERERSGRRNHYRVHPELPLRHPIEAHRRIGNLIALIVDA